MSVSGIRSGTGLLLALNCGFVERSALSNCQSGSWDGLWWMSVWRVPVPCLGFFEEKARKVPKPALGHLSMSSCHYRGRVPNARSSLSLKIAVVA